MNTHCTPTPLTLVFGTPERQRGLAAILGFIPDTRPLPHSGGRYGKGGDAVLGFGSTSPREIWCVCPTLRGKTSPTESLRIALWRGMQRAALNDHFKIGIALDTVNGLPVPWAEVAEIAIRTARAYLNEIGDLTEIRFIVADSKILTHATKLMENPEDSD